MLMGKFNVKNKIIDTRIQVLYNLTKTKWRKDYAYNIRKNYKRSAVIAFR